MIFVGPTMTRICLILLALTSLTSVRTGWCPRGEMQQTKPSPGEQIDFGAEDNNWARPIRVPTDVVQILRDLNHASADEIPESSLLASEIHLGKPEQADLIVKGIHNLQLPHAALFWVFRPTSKSHELILSTGGDALRVLSERHNGYRDIRVWNNTARASASALYQFDGRQYILATKTVKPLR